MRGNLPRSTLISSETLKALSTLGSPGGLATGCDSCTHSNDIRAQSARCSFASTSDSAIGRGVLQVLNIQNDGDSLCYHPPRSTGTLSLRHRLKNIAVQDHYDSKTLAGRLAGRGRST